MGATWTQPAEVGRRTKTMASQAVDRGTTMLADRIEHYTTVAREVSDALRRRGEPQSADLVDSLIGRVNGVAQYLRTSDGETIMSDMQEYAQGHTWLLAGVGLVGGLAAARAIRSNVALNGAMQSEEWDEPEYVDSFAQNQGMPTE